MKLAAVPAHPRRLVFLGTPAIAVSPLEALVEHGFEVALAVTRADKRRGRGGDLTPSPVKAAATALRVPVSHRVDDSLDVGADLGVVVAFGQIVRRPVLEVLPMVNLHFSLLPRWRGAAPVERALLAGDTVTGVCLMQLEEGLDTGPVFARAEVPIGPRTKAADLRAELVRVGTDLLVGQLAAGLREPVPQEGEATYAAKLDPAELAIDWERPAAELDRLVRVGGAFTTLRGQRLKVLAARPLPRGAGAGGAPGALDGARVATGEGALELLTVQPEGKAAMPVAAWRNGARLEAGDRLGS